jgi:hypothetical protein
MLERRRHHLHRLDEQQPTPASITGARSADRTNSFRQRSPAEERAMHKHHHFIGESAAVLELYASQA